MIVHVFQDAETAGLAAAQLFAAALLKKPDSVLGLATGSTPLETYRLLSLWHQQGLLDFSESISFNLDEYVGLAPDHPASYHRFMQENLFSHINMLATYVPHGDAEDPEAECRRYDALIAEHGGIDIQFLGLGSNGHIGFNEPSSVFSHGAQVVALTPSTIQANSQLFERVEDMPKRAITVGTGGIMQAREIVLVAYGENKAQAIHRMMTGEVDPLCPASILRLHPNVTLMLDEAAAAGLPN